MFDWNDHHQVADTIWGDLSESEDHTVPYPKDTDKSTVFTFGDYCKKQKNGDVRTVGRSNEQTSGVENEFPGSSLENTSSFRTQHQLSASRVDMDTWPDLPSLSSELTKGYSDESDRDTFERDLMNKVAVKLDGEHEPFGDEHDDRGSDNFLDCGWAIRDFGDLDRIFGNEPIFGDDLIITVDEFLSPPTDVIGSTAQSIPMPDIPSARDEPPSQGCSSLQFVEDSHEKGKRDEKTADSTVETRRQTFCQAQLTNQLSEKEDRKKKLLKSRRKAEERIKNKNLNDPWSQKICQSQQFPGPNVHHSVISPLQTFQSTGINQQGHVGGAELMGHLGSSNQFMFSQYGYPTYPFPGIPVVPHAQAERNAVAVGHKLYPGNSKHPTDIQVPDEHSTRLSMTPQEKIEKLRRRQQIQAMLAIQQQQQQFGHQTTVIENMASQENSLKNQCQDVVTSNMEVAGKANMLPPSNLKIVEHDECQRNSTLIDDNFLEESVYYQLQDALHKLDIKVRLCIRDSLFRLARSAMERQCASDRSSTNKSARNDGELPVNEETKNRHTRLPDVETYTNPIDRTVAELLFHNPLELRAKPVNDEVPESSVSCNPGSKLPLNVRASTSNGGPESFGEMEVQTSP